MFLFSLTSLSLDIMSRPSMPNPLQAKLPQKQYYNNEQKEEDKSSKDIASTITKEVSNSSVFSRLIESVKKCNNKKLLKKIKHQVELGLGGPLTERQKIQFSSFSSIQKEESLQVAGSVLVNNRKLGCGSRNSQVQTVETNSTYRSNKKEGKNLVTV